MYDLHRLGWYSFQQLCHTVVREILGQTVEQFLEAQDGGRDGAFAGTWHAMDGEDITGRFVIQCKFTSKANYNIKVSDIADEVSKAERLVERGLCDSYILMTNAGISGPVTERLGKRFEAVGVRHFRVFGSAWINQQITENKRLRMHVPRLYGLGDLSQILDERAYEQARVIIESMREDLSKVIITSAYRRAIEAINEHHFVLLVGEPAVGKTTIATLLAMSALDTRNASVLKLDSPEQVVQHWNPSEPAQFFWIDDAFGVTQYEHSLAIRWNHIMPQLRAMLHARAIVVMTSRDYIYNRARQFLKESSFPLLNESQVVVEVEDLSLDEKRQILYNHMKLGNQDRSFRTRIKPYLESAASHARFIPETARRLSDPFFTRDLTISDYGVKKFVKKREQLLQETLQGLDSESKSALALVYMRSGSLESPIGLQASEEEALERLGGTLGGVVAALEAMKGSLVLLSNANDQTNWQFKHPTISDAYSTILAQSTESIGIFIQGSSPLRLMDQVTCGDVGYVQAVIVPTSLFSVMIKRIEAMVSSTPRKSMASLPFDMNRRLFSFLGFRCSRAFLSMFIERHPELLEGVSSPGMFLDSVPEVDLAKRLFELELLPEKNRLRFIETVSNYFLDGEDGGALIDKGIKEMFTMSEWDDFVRRIKTELLPRLDAVRDNWEYNYSSGDVPEDHMQPLVELLQALKKLFEEDADALHTVWAAIEDVEEWIGNREPDEHDFERWEKEEMGPPLGTHRERSVFDDIDV